MDATCLFFVLLAALVDAASIPLTMSRAHINLGPRDDLNLSCSSSANFTRCQFKVGLNPFVPGHVIEGDKGRCQVTIPWNKRRILDGTYMEVGCRVRQEGGDWSYATSSAYWSSHPTLALNVTPTELVASLGDTVTVLAHTPTPTPLATCTVRHEGKWLGLNDTPPSCRDSVCYHGNGLAVGECGVTLRNLSEKDNGKLWLRLGDQDRTEGMRLVNLIVAKPPQSVTLQYKVTEVEGGTSTLVAWCTVIGGRPTPDVEWFIGGVPVSEGVASVPGEEWAWPSDERNLNQSLTRTLREGDNGKALRCTATSTEELYLSYTTFLPSSFATLETSPTTQSDFVDGSEAPESLNHNAESAYSPDFSVAACALFGVAIFLYVAVLSLADLITFAWRREMWCFKHLSYGSGASLDTDVMDYHATMPSAVTLRGDVHVESYLEPIHPAQRQDSRESYFMPVTDQSNRSSAKVERTLGLTHPRSSKPPPTPRFIQSTLKKQKSNSSTLKSAQKSLYMPTPVDQILDELGASGSSDESPLYHNIVPAARSDPMYLNIAPDTEETLPVYGNLEPVAGDAIYGNIEATSPGEAEPTYHTLYPHQNDGDRVYGNF